MGTREARPSRRSDKDDARYESVTLEDIRRITKKYLSEEKFVISVVQPGK
jgi:predicted Zn-dependent peptidase